MVTRKMFSNHHARKGRIHLATTTSVGGANDPWNLASRLEAISDPDQNNAPNLSQHQRNPRVSILHEMILSIIDPLVS
jgi:hypothetical protein